MGKVIAVTSGKGGTGKTSLTAGVSVALALHGQTVLCIDTDIGLKNLDLSLGMSDRVMMDFSDVITGRCSLERACAPHPQLNNLHLLTAPMSYSQMLTPHAMIPMVEFAARQYDYIMLDSPAGVGRGFELATCAAHRALLVSTTDASSLRDARRAVEELSHVRKLHLVMNRVQPKLLKKLETTLDHAMDKAGLQLVGVVPEDERVMIYANQGKLVVQERRAGAGRAYTNIARRLMGQNIPLMTIR